MDLTAVHLNHIGQLGTENACHSHNTSRARTESGRYEQSASSHQSTRDRLTQAPASLSSQGSTLMKAGPIWSRIQTVSSSRSQLRSNSQGCTGRYTTDQTQTANRQIDRWGMVTSHQMCSNGLGHIATRHCVMYHLLGRLLCTRLQAGAHAPNPITTEHTQQIHAHTRRLLTGLCQCVICGAT